MGIYLQSESGATYSLPPGKVTAGRVPSNHIVINNHGTSKQHAGFLYQQGRVWITDLDSSNGTFVNGQRLDPHQAYPLNQGDQIQFGTSEAFVLLGGDEGNDTMMVNVPQLPPPASRRARPSYTPGTKPGKLQAIAILCLIGGILNILWSITVTCSAIASIMGVILLPITLYPLVLGVFELIYASELLPDPPKARNPATYLAVMQILNIITGNLLSVIIGILSLVFYNDPEVKAYFNRR